MNRLWLRQVQGVLRLELRKNLLGMRAAPMYILALLPLFVVFLFILVSEFAGTTAEFGPAGAATFFSHLFQFILRFVVYFGCVWLFMNLFRGEILDRSLHYYFLSPIRREVLVAGKFLSAWVTTCVLFGAVTLICFVSVYAYLGGGGESILGGTAAGQLVAYLGIVLLGCLGYGAVFLVVGLFFRNSIVPALIFFLWESANGLLPGLLKKISVLFYLQSMFPVPVSDGPFAVLVDPVSAWIGVPGLILFTAAVMVVAGLRIRRMEISYASD
jgi:ABC-type transport system involved in multi-copper enzyme maturation permease subunit